MFLSCLLLMYANITHRYPLRNTFIGGNYTLPGSWKCLDSNEAI